MNKKYISLGLLAATLLVWLIGPIIDYFFSFTCLDLLSEMEGAGIGDYLLVLVPPVAVVLGALGAFVKPALVKIAGLVGGIGYTVAALLQLISAEFEIAVFGWGFWGLLVLLVANLVVSLKAE